MFGRGKVASPHPTPAWMHTLARDIVGKPIGIEWFPTKAGKWYGCAYHSGGIELHCDATPTHQARKLLVHECGHVLVPKPSKCPYTKRVGYHGKDFWHCVAKLYAMYGLYEFAIFNEGYAIGRRYLAEHYAEYMEYLEEIAA